MLSGLDGLNSINCTGSDTCYAAVVSLSRDIVCTSTSTDFNSDACGSAEFTLTKGGDHVAKYLGEGVCYQAQFDFAANSTISFECDLLREVPLVAFARKWPLQCLAVGLSAWAEE